MTPNDFVMWLRGYIDGVGTDDLPPKITKMIRDKLSTVAPEIQWYPTVNPPYYETTTTTGTIYADSTTPIYNEEVYI